MCGAEKLRSNELSTGLPELVQHFHLLASSQRRKSAACPKYVGYIARLSQWGRGGVISRSKDFYLPSLQIEEGGGGRHPVSKTPIAWSARFVHNHRCFL